MLELASAAVADRGLNYGSPEDNFQRIANLWEAFLFTEHGYKISISPADVAMLMILMKVARLIHQPAHLDSVVDLAGYAACLGNITCWDTV